MYSGKTVFAQLMDCLPWSTFFAARRDVRTFPCVEQYRAMAFAPTDLPGKPAQHRACLSAQPAKLSASGISRTDPAVNSGGCQ